MKFDKTTIIGLVFCAILLFTWEPVCIYFGWIKPPAAEEQTTASDNRDSGSAPAAPETDGKKNSDSNAETEAKANDGKDAVKPEDKKAEENKTEEKKPEEKAAAASGIVADESVSNDFVTVTVSGKSGAVTNIRFLKFKHNDRENDITISDCALFDLIIPDAVQSGNAAFEKSADGKSITVNTTLLVGGTPVQLSRIYTVKSDYIIDCTFKLTNKGDKAVTVNGAVLKGGSIAPWHHISGDKVRTVSHRLDYYTADGDLEDVDGDDDDEDYFLSAPPRVLWTSVNNKYFCSVLKAAGNKPFELWQERPRRELKDDEGDVVYVLSAGAVLPSLELKPGEPSETFEFASYTGPKSAEALAEFVPDGEDSMHLAWGPLNLLARFLMWLLNLLYSLCGSYGVSIILLTLLVRTAFYPLTSKGNESMRKMQKVQPLFKELKEKYKDDPQLLNQKMTELYRKEGINPLAGCLPVLLQIPIFFALYAMLDNAIALRHVSFLWAENLAAADTVLTIPLYFFDLPLNPLVIAMTVLMVIQQRMTPMSADPMQKKMMMFMPIVMLVFLYELPSGLTLYWTVSNLFSIVQLWLQKKRNQAREAAEAEQSK
jgi:YidC/Oxa1 family membrane protein insertase